MINAIVIITTLRCDLKCEHCLQGHPDERPDFPLDIYAKLLRDARPYGAKLISFSGGEPRLHPQFDEMVRLTVENGYSWNTVSNGQNVAPLLEILEKYGRYCTKIYFSLDGATPEIHDDIRNKKGAFKRLESSVRAVLEKGYKVGLTSCLNRKNKHQLEDLIKLGEKWGVKEMKFAGVIPVPGNEFLRLTDAENLALFERILELNKDTLLKLGTTSALYTRGGVEFCSVLSLRKLAFNANGEMILCCDAQEDNAVIGSLRDFTLEDLMSKWLDIANAAKQERLQRIKNGQMGAGFDTCVFCTQLSVKQR